MPPTLIPCYDSRWLVPGSTTFTVLCPVPARRYHEGAISEAEALAAIDRHLQSIVIGAMADLGLRSRSLAEDLVQAMYLRIATMDAAARYDPSQSSPATYLRGIARTLVRELYFRRSGPRTVTGDALESVVVGGDQLDRAVHEELLDELRYWLDQLSPGEIRALVREFGPLFGSSPPKGRRRRLRNPDALPRALEILRELAAHRIEQERVWELRRAAHRSTGHAQTQGVRA